MLRTDSSAYLFEPPASPSSTPVNALPTLAAPTAVAPCPTLEAAFALLRTPDAPRVYAQAARDCAAGRWAELRGLLMPLTHTHYAGETARKSLRLAIRDVRRELQAASDFVTPYDAVAYAWNGEVGPTLRSYIFGDRSFILCHPDRLDVVPAPGWPDAMGGRVWYPLDEMPADVTGVLLEIAYRFREPTPDEITDPYCRSERSRHVQRTVGDFAAELLYRVAQVDPAAQVVARIRRN